MAEGAETTEEANDKIIRNSGEAKFAFVFVEEELEDVFLCYYTPAGKLRVENVDFDSPRLVGRILEISTETDRVLITGCFVRAHNLRSRVVRSKRESGDEVDSNILCVRFPANFVRVGLYRNDAGFLVVTKLAEVQYLLSIDAGAMQFEEVLSDVSDFVMCAFKTFSRYVICYIYALTKSSMLLLDPDRFQSILVIVNLISPLLDAEASLSAVDGRFFEWEPQRKSWSSISHPLEEQLLLTVRIFNCLFPYIDDSHAGIRHFFGFMEIFRSFFAVIGPQELSDIARPKITEDFVQFIKTSEYVRCDLDFKQVERVFMFTCLLYGKLLPDCDPKSPETESVLETLRKIRGNVVLKVKEVEDDAKVGMGCILHVVLVEGVQPRLLPSVLSHGFVFRLVLGPCVQMIKHPSDDAVKKSLELLVGICTHKFGDEEFGRDFAEVDGVTKLFVSILNITRFNQKKDLRSLALDGYYRFIKIFDSSAKTYIFSELLKVEKEVGLREFLTVDAKSYFCGHKLQLGLPFHRLVENLFRIPPEMLTDSVAASHWLIAAIGFVKVLTRKGFREIAQLGTFLNFICKEFVLPLQASMRSTYARLSETLQKGGTKVVPEEGPEVGVQIGNGDEDLPQLTLEQKIKNVELSMTTLILLRQEYLTMIRDLKALPDEFLSMVPFEVFDHGLGNVE